MPSFLNPLQIFEIEGKFKYTHMNMNAKSLD